MSVIVTIDLNGFPVPVTLDADALAAIAAAIGPAETAPPSPFMTIPEAAAYLRCNRQRIDDLLSSRRLTRCKDGSRTLIRRDELTTYLEGDTR